MKKRKTPSVIFIGGSAIILLLLLFFGFSSFHSRTPVEVVDSFYDYEQKGDFGSSWDLFHSEMKERFSKNAYVTERSHIYMSHFGVTTFSYEIIQTEKLKKWKMTKSGQEFTNVKQVTVKLLFPSKFGVFTIIQDVYVVKEDREWKVLWEFKE
ncbi:hypothetical protein [Bacillus sp. FJAT-47783]|uniref:hypothetical protein n=1 Tax=Bacillus sp. FJAT-47783 TaxID=2922712 RepID=UPI001FACEEE5|nr:hypothetical protein [Bacillus sp. FJAT-47783]